MFIGYLFMYGRNKGDHTPKYKLDFIYATCGFS